VTGPNNATAEVRGTEFAIIVEVNASGQQIVHLDVYTGSVDARAQGSTISVGSGQTTVIGPAAAPTPVQPIPPGERQDSWTVFNLSLIHI